MLGTPAIADTIHTDSPPGTNMAFTPQKIPHEHGYSTVSPNDQRKGIRAKHGRSPTDLMFQ